MWNHNTHFHSYLLRQLPATSHHALDVGCGLGDFAKVLAKQVKVVDALDGDQVIISEARKRNNMPNINYLQADFLQADLSPNSYDVIVAIASLHHINLEAALPKMKLLLRPSGKLLILGLYRETTIIDYFYSLISIPLNWIYRYWHQTLTVATAITPPTHPANLSFHPIKSVAFNLLPGCSLRRHLLWRYSLIWQKPN